MFEKEISSNKVIKVKPDNIASELGIEKGDRILKINNKKIKDIIDYLYQISDEYLEIELQKENGEIWILEVEKEYDEDLGLDFENPILDNARSCSNKCIFCFIDQLPKGMRKSLYFKDDDSRLSFLQGNFVTLTNINEKELDRIIEYNISPINVSIHTTNPELRIKMLNNKNAGNILERLRKLTSNRIIVNGQIVLCPGINDKEELDRTIEDLYPLYPNLHSLAVVPVGITKFRENLFKLTPFDGNKAKDLIIQIEKWQKFLLNKINTRFVYLADEFFVLANEELPSYESYEDFPQTENGVGLLRKFEHEFMEYLNSLKINDKIKREVSIVTGVAASSFLEKLLYKFKEKFPKIDVNLYTIINNFFGSSITVSGLLTGKDIIEQLSGKDLGDKVILPKSMFKANERILLDDVTAEDIKKQLNTEIEICEVNGKDLIYSIIH